MLIDNIQAIASIAPAAPKRWPVDDFVELIDISLAYFENVFFIAFVSFLSLYIVDVPCALI